MRKWILHIYGTEGTEGKDATSGFALKGKLLLTYQRTMRGAYGIVGLLLVLLAAVAVLPMLRNMFAPVFPEGFRNVDCKGMSCPEGQFCQENKCHDIYPAITNKYF
jgi:hypothetical protein